MEKLKKYISRIIVIILTINLVVFSAIPNRYVVYGDDSISELQQQIVDYAKQWVGVTPYVWGGTSLTDGADCSGFVMAVYKEFGIDLPHGTASLINQGAEVSWSDVQLGDVIVTRSSASGTGRHTGIYAGDGQWVNASSSRTGTRQNNVPTDNIITIRRIVGHLQSDGRTPTIYPSEGGSDSESSGSSGSWSISGFSPQGEVDDTSDDPIDLDRLEFEFLGNPSKMEYNGTIEISSWLFSKFSQFVDYILGIMIQGVKGAIVGWTEIIEGMVDSILKSLNNGVGDNTVNNEA